MADETKVDPPVQEELAGIAGKNDITRGFVDPMKPLDPTDKVLLGRGGGDYELYEEIRRDDQVQSTFQQRRLAVVSQPWEVVAASEDARDVAAADYLRDTLKRINFDRTTEKMLNGIFYGYAVAECMWFEDGSNVALSAVKVRKQRRFKFMPDGSLRLRVEKPPEGAPMPERKFWVFSCGAEDDDEPYGRGLAHWLYWPVYFKRHDLKFWLMFIEKCGGPSVVGKYKPGATEKEKDTLLAAAQALQTDAAVTIPDTMILQLLEAARTAADQATFYDRMDAAIAKIVLSQTMTTDDGSSLAQGNVHMTVRQEVVRADADLVCESFNAGPARWLTEWNFPGANPPQVWRKMSNDGELKFRADLLKTITEMGVVQPTQQYITDTFGGEWEARTAAPMVQVPGVPGIDDVSAVDEPAPAAPAAGAANAQAEALNGAQVTSLVELVAKVAAGELPRDAAVEIAMLAFLIDRPTAERILGKAGKGFKPALPDAPALAPAPAFADPTEKDAPATLADQLDDAAAAVTDDVFGLIKKAVQGSKDYDELLVNFTELVGSKGVDPTALAAVLQGGFAVADLTGRSDVKDENRTPAKAKRG